MRVCLSQFVICPGVVGLILREFLIRFYARICNTNYSMKTHYVTYSNIVNFIYRTISAIFHQTRICQAELVVGLNQIRANLGSLLKPFNNLIVIHYIAQARFKSFYPKIVEQRSLKMCERLRDPVEVQSLSGKPLLPLHKAQTPHQRKAILQCSRFVS